MTTANTDLANALKHEFATLEINAQLVDTASKAQADLVVLTEGTMAGAPPLTRHWSVLKHCKSLRDAGSPIVLLGHHQENEFGALSGFDGLTKTLRQEWPETLVSSLDVSKTSSVKDIARTILTNQGDSRLHSGKLAAMTVADIPLPLPNSTRSIPPGNWLITGGARGVTAACAIELARHVGSSKFFLAGRSEIADWPATIPDSDNLMVLRAALIQAARGKGERPKPADIDKQARALLAGREVRHTLTALTATGIEAHYIQLDVSNRRNVRTTLTKLIQSHGPITGLIHGAGVLADRQAIQKTKADVTKVFAPKVGGLLNILETLDLSALTHCGLFSSAAAVFGNPGQSDYAMANSWLNNVAEQLHATQSGLNVKSFCWGPWAGGMVDETLAAHFSERGIALIDLQNGAEIFANHLLYGDRNTVNLLIGDRWSA